ncbi:general vesicular transport factor p115-like isoform X4 [Penaeus monodon]|uniref:general vesicular transport factor p115-like isoform X4 n=1 Tax=Penaeus monodon TaxID=6687 RepID=UPI0018A764E0|nr:general vesicular transport factor p115-like isoform X4 [Penaeus monodon]
MKRERNSRQDRLLRVSKQNLPERKAEGEDGEMDLFRSVTQSVLGTPQQDQKSTGADTVDRLIDRVQSSTLLEDRRDGCRALKAMSRKYRVLVGAHGMDSLLQVLESDRNDHEIVNYALETLVNITAPEVFPEETEDSETTVDNQSSEIGEQFTEILTKRQENIALLVSLLDEFDFKVRYPTIKLLTNLLKNRPKDLQEVILVIPSGVSKLMDQLSDSREVIRNDTLLLLTQLTKSNTNLQKIVAFENAHDHLFDIIREEGYADGGVVVEDCLILMLNLLRNNPSNQTFFKEGSYIQRLTSFFTIPLEAKDGWSAQKVTNIHYMLQLVQTLVAPQNSAQVVTSCQKVMNQCGLLQALTGLLMATGVPVDILTVTITTVADMIRGNQQNQEFFADMMAPSNPPRLPAIVVLLMSMVNDKQPFILRCAVLYCFQCFLYRNQTGQAQIIQTLLPQTADEANSVTAGQLLCSGLFSLDPVSNWFAAVALSHSLVDNIAQKENMLRVQLATSVGSPPVSLMQQCTSILQAGTKIPTRLGILMLLSTWLSHCPVAVQNFLSIPTAVPYLTAHVQANEHDELELVCQGLCAFVLGLCGQFNDGSSSNFSQESLRQLVSDRIGAENFSDKLSNISRTEAYTKAAKSPQLSAKQSSDLVFDHEFCRLFKSLEVSALRAVTPQLVNGTSTEVSPAEVKKYKDIIRDQDAEMTQLREQLSKFQSDLEQIASEKENLASKVQQLHDENTVLKAQQGMAAGVAIANSADTTSEATSSNTEQISQQLAYVQQQLAEMTHARDYYYYEMVKKDQELTAVQQQNGPGQQAVAVNGLQTSADNATSNPELENVRKQLEDLQLVLYNKDSEIQQLKEKVAEPAASEAPKDNAAESQEVTVFQKELEAVKASKATLEQEKASLELQLKDIQNENNQLKTQLATASGAGTNAGAVAACSKCEDLQAELKGIQGEQEDLLVLVTDQDSKMAEYRRKLRSYGEDVTDDEDEDDEDGDYGIPDDYDEDLEDLQ